MRPSIDHKVLHGMLQGMSRRMFGTWGTLLLGLALTGAGCSADKPTAGDNKVFFVGYVYDGASGARLPKTALSSVSILYGQTNIKVDSEDDGRFVSRDPLPTWRDYTVIIDA